MRTCLLPSAVRAACYNLNRKNNEGRLFELAKVYNPVTLPLSELPVENEVLSLVVFGENEDFFTLKGVIEGIVDNFCADTNVEYVKANVGYMHPTRSAEIIINGVKVGYFGQMHPSLIEKLGGEKPVYGGEIYYNKLKEVMNDKIVFKQISKFPIIERDIAVLIDSNVLCGDVIKTIQSVGGEYLSKVELFDVYQGSQVEEGKKSMAFNLIFVSNERTLNVEEIDTTINNILNELEAKLGAKLR
jgi:phenylalanyl-tRNA synthetase beta chain